MTACTSYRELFGVIPGDFAEAAQGKAKATRIEWADGTVELAPGAPADVADDLMGALDGLGARRSFGVRLATRTEIRDYRDDLIEAERESEILDPPMYWVD
jgi:hypothetical protein